MGLERRDCSNFPTLLGCAGDIGHPFRYTQIIRVVTTSPIVRVRPNCYHMGQCRLRGVDPIRYSGAPPYFGDSGGDFYISLKADRVSSFGMEDWALRGSSI